MEVNVETCEIYKTEFDVVNLDQSFRVGLNFVLSCWKTNQPKTGFPIKKKNLTNPNNRKSIFNTFC